MVQKRYFWRRGLAYLLDVILCGIIMTFIVAAINNLYSTNISNPWLPGFNRCEIRDDLFSKELMDEKLPLADGETHKQYFCTSTSIIQSDEYFIKLEKILRDDGGKVASIVRKYYSNESRELLHDRLDFGYVSFVYPLIFSILLSKYGFTPGKKIVSLRVYNASRRKADFKSCVIREYTKVAPLVVADLLTMFGLILSIDTEIYDKYYSGYVTDASDWIFEYLLISVIIYLSYFLGSFVWWKGQSYWDRVSNLYVGPSAESMEDQHRISYRS